MRVLVDANVLFPKTTRDWLSLLYGNGGNRMFHVFWTEDILTEVLYRLRRKHPSMDGGSLRDVHDKIVATFEVGRVETTTPRPSFQTWPTRTTRMLRRPPSRAKPTSC